ncbi:MAG: DegV family protein [Eubacteriales bacterium]|nr:DegV family protein [Eubacteriales bacterium]
MKREKIALLVDSGCDLEASFIQKYSIYVAPFLVNYDGEEYTDGVDLDPLEVYRRFPQQIPKTSTPSIQTVEDTVRQIIADGYESIVAIDVSDQLSSTISTVSMVLSEHSEIPSFVLNTKNISIGSGFLAMWAAKKIKEGMRFADLKKYLPEKVKDSKVLFYMDTLDYLKAGGRIGGVTSVVGSLLKIRPIISCDADGRYETVALIRGDKNAKKKLLELAGTFSQGNPCWLALLNGAAPEEAEAMKPMLKKEIRKGKIVAEHQITASLAVHTGPGLLGIGILRNP